MSALRPVILGTVTFLALPWLLLLAGIRSLLPRRIPKALVIQSGQIGDLVCITPMFRSLVEGGYRVTVLCRRPTAPLLQGNPHVAEVICIDEPRYHGTLGRLRLFLSVHVRNFALTLLLMPGSTHTLLALWSAAPRRFQTVGEVKTLFENLFRPFFTRRFLYQRHQRTFDHYMLLAAAAGAPRVSYQHDLYVSPEEDADAREWLRAHGLPPEEPFAVMALRAGNALKVWPLERFVAVARYLIDSRSFPVLFLDTDPAMTRRALALLDRAQAREAYDLPLRQMMAVVRHASLFIGVDTGPLYIAHALGVPVIDILGPVDPAEQPPPPSGRVVLVSPPPPCKPCTFVGTTPRVPSEEQRRCVDSTTEGMVIEGVDQLLSIALPR